MIVGTEWLVEATGCDAESLRDLNALKTVFANIIRDLDLKVVGDAHWHKFPGEAGVTGLALLTESHLACHTYPEHNLATFNLYCCRERTAWDWKTNLQMLLGAENVHVTYVVRGAKQFAEPKTAELTQTAGGEIR